MGQQRWVDNPFYLLGLPTDCSRADMEREGQKLLGMLELGLPAAKSYQTPLGPMARTADKVRQAMAELRDPSRRLLHELWAALPAAPLPDAPAGVNAAAGETAPAPWPGAPAALGFGAPRWPEG